MKKNILITGASGFIGMYVSKLLTKRGYDVTGVARTMRSLPGDFKFISRDLVEPFDIAGDFDIIIHAAVLNKGAGGTFRDLWRNNVLATANVLDFAVTRRIPRLIFLSSADVFGDGAHGIIDENSPIINQNPYGLSKYAAELLLNEQNVVSVISLRLPGVIGAGASGVWLANVVAKLVSHEPVTIYSPEFETANFVHLDDLTDFFEVIFDGDNCIPRTLVLACKRREKVINIVEYAKKTLRSSSPIRVGKTEKPSYSLDASRAFSVGYKSKNPLNIVDAFLETFVNDISPD